MAKNRVVLTFSASPTGVFRSLSGWSETLWRNVDEDPATLLTSLVGVGLTPPTIPYLYDRRRLLTPGWRIDGVKVYPITGGRIVASKSFPGNSQVGLFETGSATEEQQPYDRLLWKMVATGGHSRGCRVGGIHATVVDPGGNYTGEPAFDVAFESFFIANLVANNFGLRFGTITSPYVINDVTTDNAVIAGASPRTPVLVIAGNVSAVFAAGTTVRISQCSSPARLNGQWRVDTVAVVGGNTQVRLFPKRSLTVTGAYTAGAFAVAITFGVVSMTTGSPVRGVSRKAGRPSGLPRGRRSRRV